MKISDISEINSSSLSSSINFDEYRYLDTSNLIQNTIYEIQVYKNKKDLPSRAKRLVSDGDILISTVRPIQCHYGYIVDPENNLVVSTGFAVVTPNTQVVDGRYLYYFLTQDKMTKYFQMMAESAVSSYPSITSDVISDVEIKLPSLLKQQEISTKLKVFDDKLSNNLQLITGFEELTQLLFYKWFVDFNFPDENGNPYKDFGGEMVELDGKKIPTNWRFGKFDEIMTITTGKRPEAFKESFSGIYNVPAYGASKIIGYTNDFLFNEPVVLTGRVGTHGKLMREYGKCWPSDNTLVIQSKNLSFVYQLLSKVNFSKLNKGSSQPLITQSDIKKIKCIIPTEKLIKAYCEKVDVIYHKAELLKHENNLLIEYRDLLINKLIR